MWYLKKTGAKCCFPLLFLFSRAYRRVFAKKSFSGKVKKIKRPKVVGSRAFRRSHCNLYGHGSVHEAVHTLNYNNNLSFMCGAISGRNSFHWIGRGSNIFFFSRLALREHFTYTYGTLVRRRFTVNCVPTAGQEARTLLPAKCVRTLRH